MFQSLNDESATDTRTKSANSGEKEIQTCLEQYRRTLRIDASDTQTIRDAYKQLLQKRVLLETNDIGVVANIQDGDICASLQHMTKAARVDPASSNTWAHVGRLALLAEEVPAACEAYEMALQTCGNKIEYWIALKGLSEATFKAGDFETCLRVVDQAIALNPSFEDGITMRNEMENECNRM
ncbi:hypothetical protein BC830DRAFT_854121 [Chytriomyces sp. MP71]|nr:hypothetical protein BC830DRAFT_854121 [Chytriomyces sp. MP71]